MSYINSSSSLIISNTSSFYVNYGKQGYDMSGSDNALVVASFNAKNGNGTHATETMNFTRKGHYDTTSIYS